MARPRYIFIAPWQVRAGTGVNHVIIGLQASLRAQYDTEILVVGWQQPESGQSWCKLATPELPWRNLLAFILCFLPNMLRLKRKVSDAAAVNPHYFSLELLPLALLRCLGLCPKLILSVHGADVTEALQASGLKRVLYRWLYASGDLVVACSTALGNGVKRISPKANVAIVRNGVLQPEDLKQDRAIEDKYLISVAAFVKKKGHDTLLAAFSSIAAKWPDLRLVLVGGDGPERARVLAQIKELQLEDRVSIRTNVAHSSDLELDQACRNVSSWLRERSLLESPSLRRPLARHPSSPLG